MNRGKSLKKSIIIIIIIAFLGLLYFWIDKNVRHCLTFSNNEDMVYFNGQIYFIENGGLWKNDLDNTITKVELDCENNIEKLYSDGTDELFVLDETGDIFFVFPKPSDSELYLNNGSGYRFYSRDCLEKFNQEHPYICVNGYPDEQRKTLLKDGTIAGMLDEVVMCTGDMENEKFIYLSGDFALTDAGNLYKIELSQEEGIVKNQIKCIYDGGDIVQIDAYFGCLAIKKDGEVLYFAKDFNTNNKWGEGNVSDWKNVVLVDCDRLFSVGLTSNGRILLAGDDVVEQCAEQVETLSQWHDIVKICAMSGMVIGLDKKGIIHIVELKP